MGKYISCGQYNKNFKYIIFAVFFNILVNFIFGFDLNEDFNQLLLFPSVGQKLLYNHAAVHEIFRNIGVFIFGCIFYKIEMLNKKVLTSHKISINSSRESNNIILIFNNSQNEIGSISILNLIFVITTYICIEYLSDIYYRLGLKIFDFWMFELLVISYINAKIFKLTIYKHQKFAIFFNSFICLLFRLTCFILSFSLNNENSLYKENKWLIALGLIIYVIIITIRAYSYTRIKWFIDLKYISLTKLLILIGFIGIFVSSISCVIQTYIKCSFIINICQVKNNKNSNDYYLYNFIIYIENINALGSTEIILECCVSSNIKKLIFSKIDFQ